MQWRWGESNPRPARYQRRHLRAQPTELVSEHGDSVGKQPCALSAIVFPRQSRSPGGGIPHCIAWVRRGGCPPVRQERLTTLPVRNFRCLHLCLYRLFNEDSGDLGSLPTHQRSRSKPVHPQGATCCARPLGKRLLRGSDISCGNVSYPESNRAIRSAHSRNPTERALVPRVSGASVSELSLIRDSLKFTGGEIELSASRASGVSRCCPGVCRAPSCPCPVRVRSSLCLTRNRSGWG
jgi:hypothetical protein